MAERLCAVRYELNLILPNPKEKFPPQEGTANSATCR